MSRTNDKNLEGWRVDIPVEFKERLESRFNAKNAFEADIFCIIGESCILCEEYRKDSCRKCPFGIFKNNEEYGCVDWIRNIIEIPVFSLLVEEIYWLKKDDQEAREQLERLREEAKKLINWVE